MQGRPTSRAHPSRRRQWRGGSAEGGRPDAPASHQLHAAPFDIIGEYSTWQGYFYSLYVTNVGSFLNALYDVRPRYRRHGGRCRRTRHGRRQLARGWERLTISVSFSMKGLSRAGTAGSQCSPLKPRRVRQRVRDRVRGQKRVGRPGVRAHASSGKAPTSLNRTVTTQSQIEIQAQIAVRAPCVRFVRACSRSGQERDIRQRSAQLRVSCVL